jgi:hypothetical protein
MEKYHGSHDFTQDFFRQMLNFALLVLRTSSTFVSNAGSTFQHRRIHPIGQQHTVILALIGRLNHQNGKHIKVWIYKKRGACQSTPKISAL